MTRYFVLLLALASGSAEAEWKFGQDWSTGDYVRTGAWLGLHYLDWAQTRYGIAHPGQFKELNPRLGPHPSYEDVNRHFRQTATVHIALALILPPEFRRPFQYVNIGYKFAYVERNHWAGVKFEF